MAKILPNNRLLPQSQRLAPPSGKSLIRHCFLDLKKVPYQTMLLVITVRNEVVKVMFLQVSVCPRGGGGDQSMPCRWYPSMPCSRSWGGGIPACLAGFQAHIQGGSLGGSGQGRLRPTPKGEFEGDLVQGPQPRGKGEVEGDLAKRGLLPGNACSWGMDSGDPSCHQTATVADGTHPTGMHSCILCITSIVDKMEIVANEINSNKYI